MYAYKKKWLIVLFTVIDLIGYAISSPFRLFRKKIKTDLDKILIIRVDHIGDVINSTSVLKPLKENLPESRIDFLVASWAGDIVKDNPLIDRVIYFDPPWFGRRPAGFIRYLKAMVSLAGIMKKGKYDLCLELRGDVRHIVASFLAGIKNRAGYAVTGGGFLLTHEVPPASPRTHEIELGLRVLSELGFECPGSRVKGPDLCFPEEDRMKAVTLADELIQGAAFAAVHMISGHPSKEWGLNKFKYVLQYLTDVKNTVPVVVGTEEDGMKMRRSGVLDGVKHIDLTGRINLGQLYFLLEKASVFIGLDSAPGHLAAAAGIPALVLFSGVNDPARWAPRGGNVSLIYPGEGRDLSEVDPGSVCKVLDDIIG